jgi:hypothetical protein
MEPAEVQVDIKLCLTFIFLSALLMGCGSRRAWTSADSWYTGSPPTEQTSSPLSRLAPSRIHEVLEARQADAEQLLQNVAVVELTDQQAADFVGQLLPEAPGTKPYLVRGVYLNRATGQFSVQISGDQLVVHHGSLGASAVPMKRQALVLQLEHAPAEVFVDCSMAQ